MFRRLASTQADTIKSEDGKTALQLKTKYEIDDDPPPPPPPYPYFNTAVCSKPGNVSEKIRQFNGDVVEPKLETPAEIKQNDTQRKFDQVRFDDFLNGVKTTKKVLQELNDQAIADLLSEEVMVPEVDTQIDPIFIDDNGIFAKDDLTDENKEFIKSLLDKSNHTGVFSSDEDEQQDLIQTNLTNTDLVGSDRTDYNLLFDNETNKIKRTFDVVPKDEIDLPIIDPTINVTTRNSDEDLVYVKYIPPPPDNPPQLIHLHNRYRQKVKQLRKKKEDYRKRAKKTTTQTLIKKKNKAIRNTLLKNTAVKNEDGELDIDFQITAPEQNEVDVDMVYVK